jgi:putative DNA primase/helicase
MNANEQVRLDQFFSRGGTVEQIERLVEDVSLQLISIDDLSLDWALDKAERHVERRAAQFVRRDGCLVYAVPLADRLALVSSDGNVTLASNDGQAATRATLSPQAIRRYRSDERVDLCDVITRVRELLVTHIRFSETWQPDLIALWVTGTFMHSLFAVFGYIHITSATKRCGKTLLLDLLGHLCFNATRSATDPSPAFVFRDAERNCGTQLFDEVENLIDGDRRSHAPLMAMLNAGFRRGARVPRIIDAKTNSFHEFNVYAPRVLAGINRLSTTLADRSFRITLIRKRGDEHLERFSPKQQGHDLARLRDDLHLAALQHAKEIAGAYDDAEHFPIPAETDDRLRDILEPLFAIAQVAGRSHGNGYTEAVVEAARQLANIRVEHDSGDAGLPAALRTLKALERPGGKDPVISASAALALFRRNAELNWIDTKDKARALLRRLGLRSAVHRTARFLEGDRPASAPETARGYEIRAEILQRVSGRGVTGVTFSSEDPCRPMITSIP